MGGDDDLEEEELKERDVAEDKAAPALVDRFDAKVGTARPSRPPPPPRTPSHFPPFMRILSSPHPAAGLAALGVQVFKRCEELVSALIKFIVTVESSAAPAPEKIQSLVRPRGHAV
jgi:hypothetical protein